MSSRPLARALAVGLLCLSATTAAAQSPATLGAGLSFMAADGVGAGFAVNFSKDLFSGDGVGFGPVGDLSVHTSGITLVSFAAGFRATRHPLQTHVRPYFQVLVGGSRFLLDASPFRPRSTTHPCVLVGGGVHVPVRNWFNVMVAFDVVKLHGPHSDTTYGLRSTIGVSIPAGLK